MISYIKKGVIYTPFCFFRSIMRKNTLKTTLKEINSLTVPYLLKKLYEDEYIIFLKGLE